MNPTTELVRFVWRDGKRPGRVKYGRSRGKFHLCRIWKPDAEDMKATLLWWEETEKRHGANER